MSQELLIRATWDGSPAPPSEWVTVTVGAQDDLFRIQVDAPFHGDPPPPGPVGSMDRLWEHEVVELFLLGHAPPGTPPRYTEVELSPHGHHLVLQLEGIRRVVAAHLPLEYRAVISSTRGGARFTGEALLDPALLPQGPLKVNAYSIHGPGESRRYLAMTAVPGKVPDFHRLDHFVPLTVDLP